MKSPFPGMDPYLEARWSSVHVLMVSSHRQSAQAFAAAGLEARPEEEVRIETLAGERLRGFRPDIALVDSGKMRASASVTDGGTAVAEPVRIQFHRGPVDLRNVQIVDTRDGDRVITVIEVLIPWNKLPGHLNREYVAKIEALEKAGASWVEIDLLRSSRSQSPRKPGHDLPEARRAQYLVITYNGNDGDLLGYPISIRQALPKISIPLREGDPIVALDLQAVLDRVITDGPFDSIDYAKQPVPSLRGEDAAWAIAQIANRGSENVE